MRSNSETTTRGSDKTCYPLTPYQMYLIEYDILSGANCN